MEEESGVVTVEKVRGKSTITRCFFKYPLKIILPKKVGSSQIDATWIYLLSYGGGIVSGDKISCKISVADGCTAAITTQASTKVYKSIGSKFSAQTLEAQIGSESLLAVIPDPVTCFSTAKYNQIQHFKILENSNLVFVDWITSGRFKSGENWDFDEYKSMNQVYLQDKPIFIDSVLLEKSLDNGIKERMKDYQVIAMIVILGPKLKEMQKKVKEEIRDLMSGQLRPPTSGSQRNRDSLNLIASCSSFGPQVNKLPGYTIKCLNKGNGVVIRVASKTTESVYEFLRHHLSPLESFLGAPPYSQSGN